MGKAVSKVFIAVECYRPDGLIIDLAASWRIATQS
jgi:hypothetical protein